MLFRVAIVLLLTLQACVYTQSVTQTNVPSNRSRKVEATVEKWIFFASFDSEELNRIPEALQSQCPGGQIKGVFAKEVRRLFLLTIIMKREVHLSGYCQAENQAQIPEDHKIYAEVSP